MAEENALPKRKDLRIKHYDYSARGAYFVTICTKDRQRLLSRIVTTVGVGALDDPHRDGGSLVGVGNLFRFCEANAGGALSPARKSRDGTQRVPPALDVPHRDEGSLVGVGAFDDPHSKNLERNWTLWQRKTPSPNEKTSASSTTITAQEEHIS